MNLREIARIALSEGTEFCDTYDNAISSEEAIAILTSEEEKGVRARAFAKVMGLSGDNISKAEALAEDAIDLIDAGEDAVAVSADLINNVVAL